MLKKARKALSREEILEKSDELFVEKTGAKPNPKESAYTFNRGMDLLLKLDFVEVSEEKYKLKK